MDLSSARSLMIASKNNKAVQVMLALYKEEANQFALNSNYFSQDVSNPPVLPVLRCCMRPSRGRGRCRGVVSQLALMQMCTYHQVHCTGDLNINDMRILSTSDQGFYGALTGRPHRLEQGRRVWTMV